MNIETRQNLGGQFAFWGAHPLPPSPMIYEPNYMPHWEPDQHCFGQLSRFSVRMEQKKIARTQLHKSQTTDYGRPSQRASKHLDNQSTLLVGLFLRSTYWTLLPLLPIKHTTNITSTDDSQTGQLVYWTTRGYHRRLCVLSCHSFGGICETASCPVCEMAYPRVVQLPVL